MHVKDRSDTRTWATGDNGHTGRSAGKEGTLSDAIAVRHVTKTFERSERALAGEGAGFVQVMQGFDFSRALIGLQCIAAAQASRAGKKRKSMLVVIQANPLWTTGPKTFVDEMIRMANATNVASDVTSSSSTPCRRCRPSSG